MAVAAVDGVALPSSKRRVFRVALSSTECTEVNYKDLVRAWDEQHGVPSSTSVEINDTATTSSASAPAVPAASLLPTPRTQRTQRFDIIEHLEKRYGGGAVVGPSIVSRNIADKHDDQDAAADDDLYDSEDSFIDDEELQQNIEEIHTQARVQTKHSGFFVNAGNKIETIPQSTATLADADDANDADGVAPAKKPKTAKKNGGESSRAVKAFLDDWSEAASDWQPGADILEAMEALRRTVRELTETTPFTKVFPRQLDDSLRAVDVLVVDAHPNKWRVNGYFATLMTFLPFTKQYIKSNMLRLEARDAARSVKDEMEMATTALGSMIEAYASQLETKSPEAVKGEITADKELSAKLRALLQTQDEWIAKENDYRQMLKTEDKKHMKEADYAQLNARQERNRIFTRILGMFPAGVMDLQTLRGMSKAGKAKGARKPVTVQKVVGPVKSPSTTPKRKAPATAVVAEPAATQVKRSIKPFKSRMMDEMPVFVEADFDEIV